MDFGTGLLTQEIFAKLDRRPNDISKSSLPAARLP